MTQLKIRTDEEARAVRRMRERALIIRGPGGVVEDIVDSHPYNEDRRRCECGEACAGWRSHTIHVAGIVMDMGVQFGDMAGYQRGRDQFR